MTAMGGHIDESVGITALRQRRDACNIDATVETVPNQVSKDKNTRILPWDMFATIDLVWRRARRSSF